MYIVECSICRRDMYYYKQEAAPPRSGDLVKDRMVCNECRRLHRIPPLIDDMTSEIKRPKQ